MLAPLGTRRVAYHVPQPFGFAQLLPRTFEVAQRLGVRTDRAAAVAAVSSTRAASDRLPTAATSGAQAPSAGLSVRVDGSTLPDVPVETAVTSAEAARAFAPDLVIGGGGGSCLDMAKCVAVLLTHGGRSQDYYGEFMVPGPVMPLITVPTTAGTGSGSEETRTGHSQPPKYRPLAPRGVGRGAQFRDSSVAATCPMGGVAAGFLPRR